MVTKNPISASSLALDAVIHDFRTSFPEVSSCTYFYYRAEDRLVSPPKASDTEMAKAATLVDHFKKGAQRKNCLQVSKPFMHLGRERRIYIVIFDPDVLKDTSMALTCTMNNERYLYEFALWHEIGHAVLTHYDTGFSDTHPTFLGLSSSDIRDEKRCDRLSAHKLLTRYGNDAITFIQRMADVRLLAAAKFQRAPHLTTHALDDLLSLYLKAEETEAIIAAELSGHTPIKNDIHDLENALAAYAQFHKSLDDSPPPIFFRILSAVERTLRHDEDERSAFIEHYGLDDRTYTPHFLDYFIHFGLPDIPDKDDTNYMQGILEGREPYKKDNRFPGFENFANAQFRGLPANIRREATNDGNFTNPILWKYHARQSMTKLERHYAVKQALEAKKAKTLICGTKLGL